MSDSMYNVHKYWTYRIYIVCICGCYTYMYGIVSAKRDLIHVFSRFKFFYIHDFFLHTENCRICHVVVRC